MPWAPKDGGWVWQTFHTYSPVAHAKVMLLSSKLLQMYMSQIEIDV